MSFAIETFTPVLLGSMNLRAEMHGRDPVPAADLRFRLTTSNKVLDLFDPGLRAALYRKPRNAEGDPGDEPELDGVEPVSDTPELRTASLKMPLKLTREYLGRNLVIDFGIGGKSNIELSGDVNDFHLDCKEGGTVEVDFRFQASGIQEKALGRLGSLIRHEVKITLMSSAQADNTQESVPGTGAKSPFRHSVHADGTVTDNAPKPEDEKDATQQFLENEATGKNKPAAKPKPAAKRIPNRKGAPAKKAGTAKK